MNEPYQRLNFGSSPKCPDCTTKQTYEVSKTYEVFVISTSFHPRQQRIRLLLGQVIRRPRLRLQFSGQPFPESTEVIG